MPILNVVSSCSIPAGGFLSNAVDCSGSSRILRIITPDARTGGTGESQREDDA
jgi:hypothetical protein